MAKCNCVYEEFCSMINGYDIVLPTPCEYRKDSTDVTDTNVGKWIPVTERLPEIVKTTRAWKNVYRNSDRVLCACLQKSGKRMVKEGVMELFNDSPKPYWRIPGSIDSVTHWMPLPELPKGE